MTEAAAGRLRVAVALTTCDSEEFLEPMLESLACQSRAPDVLIVGDDLSTDRTPEILERFTRRVSFPVVVIRHRERLGLHRNTASILERSRHLAEVVALADHDDVWAADKLAAVEAAFAQTLPPALWFSDAELIDELGEPLSMRLFDKVHLSVDDCAQLRRGGGLRRLVHGQTVTSPTMAFAAEIIPHCLPFPEDVILETGHFSRTGGSPFSPECGGISRSMTVPSSPTGSTHARCPIGSASSHHPGTLGHDERSSNASSAASASSRTECDAMMRPGLAIDARRFSPSTSSCRRVPIAEGWLPEFG